MFITALALLQSSSLRLPSLFCDHMVLQREADVNVWGWGKPGEPVRVTAGWTPGLTETKVEPDGTWHVSLKTAKAGGPYRLTVSSDTAVTFQDVMLGDVWVCSGQSNMEFTLGASDHAQEDVAGSSNESVRLFHVTKAMADQPRPDCDGKWQVCGPKSVASFSAVGYLFGKELNAKLGIPIGLIDATWGGTEAELWTSTPGLMRMPAFRERLETAAKSEAEYKKLYQAWVSKCQKADPGWDKWNQEGFDDSGWESMSPLKPWSQTSLRDFDGTAWFRAAVELSHFDSAVSYRIHLGTIDDNDETWCNGKPIGATEGWNIDRTYDLPAGTLHSGKNVIAVRVTDTAGEGGWTNFVPQIEAAGGVTIPVKDWKFCRGVAMSDLSPAPSDTTPHASLLFNGMINPLVKYAVKGAVWYQGESNVSRAHQYRALFPAMVQDWRRAWGSAFPFYFVQIAPFRGYGSAAAAELREAQNFALRLKDTGVAVITDAVENLDDIHPRDKRTPAHRLALWALANTYRQTGFEFSGPLYKSVKVGNNKLIVSFDHARGLRSVGGALREFEIAGGDRVYHPAQAEVQGDAVVVWSDDVKEPVACRMGWSSAPQPNLFNGAGLPASPFRTEDWPGLTDNAKW